MAAINDFVENIENEIPGLDSQKRIHEITIAWTQIDEVRPTYLEFFIRRFFGHGQFLTMNP